MTINTMSAAIPSDADLVGESLAGNRDAFGQIVTRYQSLVCALAYSATGSLSQSEDLAQETFLAAWRQLPGLREPEKLRGWLCRIVRNLACDALRAQGREPSHDGQPVEEISELKSADPQPVDESISHEEAAILWRAIERIPETYREPLVLFYRENQSIETVAASLDLSEDAVKQRLSRGRKFVLEEVLALVAGALRKTSPGKMFAFGVLAALSGTATSAKAATVGATAAKATATAKAGVAFTPAISLLPIAGSVYLTMKASVEDAKSPRERQFTLRSLWVLLVVVTGLILLLNEMANHFPLDGRLVFGVILPGALLVLIILFGLIFRQRRRQIQREAGTHREMTGDQRREFLADLRRNGSKRQVFLYLGIACNMLGLLLIEARPIHGKPLHYYFIIFLAAFVMLLCAQAWRSRPRKKRVSLSKNHEN